MISKAKQYEVNPTIYALVRTEIQKDLKKRQVMVNHPNFKVRDIMLPYLSQLNASMLTDFLNQRAAKNDMQYFLNHDFKHYYLYNRTPVVRFIKASFKFSFHELLVNNQYTIEDPPQKQNAKFANQIINNQWNPGSKIDKKMIDTDFIKNIFRNTHDLVDGIGDQYMQIFRVLYQITYDDLVKENRQTQTNHGGWNQNAQEDMIRIMVKALILPIQNIDMAFLKYEDWLTGQTGEINIIQTDSMW